MLQLLKNKNFRRLFFGNLFSGFGQGTTFIGISWYLVDTTNSGRFLGSTMMLSAIVIFFLGPYLGTLIDRFSRKRILVYGNVFGVIMLTVMAIWGYFYPYSEWMLMLLYLATMFIIQIHFPTQTAIVQETFERKDYGKINSLLEVENQIASVLAGGIAGIMLSQYSLHAVIIMNALAYLLAVISLSMINYTMSFKDQNKFSGNSTWMKEISEGWRFISKTRGFLIFGICSFMPYIVGMVSNFLAPVFVSQTLQVGVEVFSTGEIMYAVGAIIAGIFLARTIKSRKKEIATFTGILLLSMTLCAMVWINQSWSFILMFFILGWSTASTRLFSLNIYMEIIPENLMGRIMSFLNVISLIFRVLLIGIFTGTIDNIGPGIGFYTLSALLVIAAMGISYSLRKMNRS